MSTARMACWSSIVVIAWNAAAFVISSNESNLRASLMGRICEAMCFDFGDVVAGCFVEMWDWMGDLAEEGVELVDEEGDEMLC